MIVVYSHYVINMTPKRPVLDMHNGLSNGKVHLHSDKQIHVDVDTFVIHSRQVTEGGAISVTCYANYP